MTECLGTGGHGEARVTLEQESVIVPASRGCGQHRSEWASCRKCGSGTGTDISVNHKGTTSRHKQIIWERG